MAKDARPMGGMTLEDLRKLVATIANNFFVRYWIGWNHQPDGLRPPAGEPYLMALCVINADGTPAEVYERDLEREGLRKQVEDDGTVFWVVRRVDGEGRPYRSSFGP